MNRNPIHSFQYVKSSTLQNQLPCINTNSMVKHTFHEKRLFLLTIVRFRVRFRWSIDKKCQQVCSTDKKINKRVNHFRLCIEIIQERTWPEYKVV